MISICAAGGQGVVAMLESAGGAHDERPLLAARQRPARLDARQPARPAAAGRARPPQPGAPVVSGAVLSGAAPGRPARQAARQALPRPDRAPNAPAPRARPRRWSSTPPGSPTRPSWSSCSASSTPPSAGSQRCGRVVVLGTPPAEAGSTRAATAQRALEGFTRSLGKEIGGRGVDRAARLRLRRRRGPARLDPALPALAPLGLRLRPGGPGRRRRSPPTPEIDWERPLDGKVALVTGASRGIGAAIAATLAPRRRRGRRPRRAAGRATTCARVDRRGSAARRSTLDITAADAPDADRRALRRRRRRRRPQRRRHPRPHDREDAGGALERS